MSVGIQDLWFFAQEGKMAIGVDGVIGAAALRLVIKEDKQGFNSFDNLSLSKMLSILSVTIIMNINKKGHGLASTQTQDAKDHPVQGPLTIQECALSTVSQHRYWQ